LFTKLFQNYFLPKRFGYDKRKPHLSSLIVSGQISRDEALQLLLESPYEPDELEIDIGYFCKKMRIIRHQFEEFLQIPLREYSEFPNWGSRYYLLKKLQRVVEKFFNKQLRIYS